MAWAELLRTPGRSVAAGFAVAVSVAAVATLLAVQVGFGGAVAGTRLGDAVAVRVQTIDLVLLAVLVAVAVATVADVVYVGLRERRAELALLLAVGWPGPALARLVLRQAAILGVAGAAAGAAAAVATTALLGRTVPGWSLVAIGISGAALAMLATAAVTVPAMGVRALSGRVLSEEG
jgi:ABC-type antimicrobial peptide transport system permease subunit